jgi:microcompartment protein CcmK/EutM
VKNNFNQKINNNFYFSFFSERSPFAVGIPLEGQFLFFNLNGGDMILAKVVGTVVATQKEESMEGLKFLILQQVDTDGKLSGGFVVAADAVDAGVGEMVLYASGSSARQTIKTDKRPCDAVVMAIVDNWEIDGELKYKKGADD